MTSCFDCINDTACNIDSCITSYFYNNVTEVCDLCNVTFVGCDNCSATECFSCDNAANYFLNGGSGLCEQCTLTNCTECSNLSACVACAAPSFVNDSGVCEYCDPAFDMFLDGGGECILCPFVGNLTCASCSSLTTCSSCNETTLFYNATSQMCEPCSVAGCSQCTNLTTCETCNSSENVGLNVFTLRCDECDNSISYFSNPDSGFCEEGNLTGCVEYLNYTACALCDHSILHYVNESTLLCEPCSQAGCLQCNNLTTCVMCDLSENYDLNNDTEQCELCSVSCNCNGYVGPMVGGQCSAACGDGLIRVDETCDDGNAVGGDGCSSTCQVEAYCTCSGEPSCCGQDWIDLQLLETIKDPFSNTIEFTFLIVPPTPVYANANLKDAISTNFTYTSLTYSYDPATYQVTYSYYYTESLQALTAEFYFRPNFTEYCGYSPVYSTSVLEVVPNNNIPPLLLSDEEYQIAETAETTWNAIEYVSYGTMAASAIPCKVVGLELFGVVQLAFLTLADNDYVNLALAPLLKMQGINGPKANLDQTPTPTARLLNQAPGRSRLLDEVPNRVRALDYDPEFLSNCNVMLAVMLGILVAGVVVYLVALCLPECCCCKLTKVAKFLLTEILLTLVLFNCFNLSFAATLHFAYADPSSPNYPLNTLGAALAYIFPIAMSLALTTASKRTFGEFKNKFKRGLENQIYFVLTIVFRMGLGAYIAVMNEAELSAYVVLGFSMAFIMYSLINLPYKAVYHNYRCNICHFTMFIILFVTNYYRTMKSTTPIEEKMVDYTPAYIEIGAIALCVLVSFIVMIIEIYYFIQKCCCKSPRQKANRISPAEASSLKEDRADKFNSTDFDLVV